MQDYFKYDKIQRGAPLYMKSDSDGSTDKDKRGLPLGIKTTTEGIKHFTNWDNIATSIDINKGLRFDDIQPNTAQFVMSNSSLPFGTEDRTTYYHDSNLSGGDPANPLYWIDAAKTKLKQDFNITTSNTFQFSVPHVQSDRSSVLSFRDNWDISDINIVDDLAFVSYKDYTDIHKKTFNLDATVSGFYGLSCQNSYSGDKICSKLGSDNRLGTLVVRAPLTPELRTPDIVAALKSDQQSNYPDDGPEYEYTGVRLPNTHAAFDNCLLKIAFKGSNFPDAQPRTYYFSYGGTQSLNSIFTQEYFAKRSELPYDPVRSNNFYGNYQVRFSADFGADKEINATCFSPFRYLSGIRYKTDDLCPGDEAERDQVIGKFYLLPGNFFYKKFGSGDIDSVETSTNPSTKRPEHIHLALDVTLPHPTTSAPTYSVTHRAAVNDFFTETIEVGERFYEVDSIELVKIQPVRKCGKVDIYVRKRGIVNAIVNNRITSPGHGLNTNDMIKVADALFDGTQTGAVDLHPLNGEKFVKVIDEDTFDLYEDQFFENAVSTNNLKTTDGITWSCISNANDDFGQSWDYHKTLFSPTGRNGYPSTDSTISRTNFKAEPSTFITNKRIKKAKGQRTQEEIDNFNHTIHLDFTDITSYDVGTQFLDPIPENDLGRSAFDLFYNGPQSYYPYHCNNNEARLQTRSPYPGCRFGSSLSAKFSHKSGDSSIYLVAIGEQGSDISIDFFGMSDEEYSVDGNTAYYVKTNIDNKEYLQPFYKQRVIPLFYPVGKVHLLSFTVDKYGKITDISHENTFFGDGGSTHNNPTGHGPMWLSSTLNDRHQSFLNSSTTNVKYDNIISTYSDNRTAPFGEGSELTSQKSLYWDRASIAHWFGTQIYDYFNNGYNIVKSQILRNTSWADRNSATIDPLLGQKTRFLDSQINIDRFNLSGQNSHSQWYIYPWVDSFGKSVGITGKDNSGNTHLLGASTALSNIDIDNTTHGSNWTKYLRPFGYGYDLTDDELDIKIGQVTEIVLNSSYNVSEVFDINAGGSVRNYPSLSPSSNVFNKSGTDFIRLNEAPIAGNDLISIYNNLHRSTNQIIAKDGYLMWGDQIGREYRSTINILSHDINASDQYAEKNLAISRDWVDLNFQPLMTDGFGMNIRYDNETIVTNAMSKQNDLGEPLGGRYDVLMLYQLNKKNNTAKFMQQISPTFSSEDEERYPQILLRRNVFDIVNIDNVTYGGDIIKSNTWNVRLMDRYDVFSDNILLRDPIEFCIFSKDYSVDNLTYSPNITTESDSVLRPYLSFVEHFKNNNLYYDYATKDDTTIQDMSLWEISQPGTIQNIDNLVSTPVFFMGVSSLGQIDRFGDLKVKVRLDSASTRFMQEINFDFTSTLDLLNNNDFILPRLVLYGKDPRSMVVPNGPVFSGNNTDRVQITDGIYTSQPGTLTYDSSLGLGQKRSIYRTRPPLFRGGANDLFLYGSYAGSPVSTRSFNNLFDFDDTIFNDYHGGRKTLGELFDLTYNKAGNTNRGIISWASLSGPWGSPASTSANPYVYDNLFPYATIISTATSLGNNYYEFTIPYSTWKDYIIRGDHIKDSSDNRPMFDSFTRIKHGTLSSTSPFAGTWDQTYDDSNRPTYNPKTIISNGGTQEVLPEYTIAIGLVMSSLTSVDIRNNSTTTGNFGNTQRSRGASQNLRNTKFTKPPYSIITANSTLENAIYYSHNFSSTLQEIECSLVKQSYPKRRFKNTYHKVAYFKYNNDTYDEVQKNAILSGDRDRVEKYAFGRYSFTPLPVGGLRGGRSTSRNTIVRIGTSEANSHNAGGNKGTFSKSLQVLTSDNIVAYSSRALFRSEYYFKDGDINSVHYNVGLTGVSIGSADFSATNLLGGLDIREPEYLSLHISAIPSENNPITLFTNGVVAVSGDTTLKVDGVDFHQDDTTLWIGQRIRNTGIPLNISGPDIAARMPLVIEEKAPSGIAPLYTDAPDIFAPMTLSFTPPGTGDTSLFVSGPIADSGDIPLNTKGKAFNFGQTTLFTSGIGLLNKTATLNTEGVNLSEGSTTIHIGHIKHNDNTTLWSYGAVPDSGVTTLTTRGRASFNSGVPIFIGTQFEFEDKKMNLMVENNVKLDRANIPAIIDGKITSINSLTHGEGDFVISRNNNLIDITTDSELPVNISTNSKITRHNSITERSYTSTYDDKSIFTDSVLEYFGSQPKSILAKNPANILKSLSSGGSKIVPFYSDESLSDLTVANALIKRETYDSNGKAFVVANTEVDGGPISIDLYNIVRNNNIEFRSKLYLNLCRNVPDTPESDDLDYAKNGIADSPFGDSFVSLRRRLKEYFDSSFVNDDLVLGSCHVVGQDLKISQIGTVALSLRIKLRYANDSLDQSKSFSVIILFHSASVSRGDSSIIAGYPTYYTEDYDYYILQESGSLQNKISLGQNIAFDEEDLYFNKMSGQWGQIWKLSHSDMYQSAINVIDFGQSQDVDGYTNPANTFYINEENKKVAFGSTIKICDDYNAPGSKIMFVGAPLFDPYTFNVLSAPHSPNPIGAVYIYKRAIGSSNWTYFGAVYGKGNTSDNVLTNISDYRDSSISGQQYCLFGYDFDYSEGNLVVSEPGGDGALQINTPQSHLFKIGDSIELLKTYIASDVVMPDGSTLSSENNYGSHILLLGSNNPITYSDSDFGNGIIHYLKNNNTDISSTQYVASSNVTAVEALQNLVNENKYYEDPLLVNYNQDLITRGYKISSIKKLDFGNNIQKLAIVKTFTTRVQEPVPINLAFDLQKISILDLQREAFSLFISGPSTAEGSITVAIDTIGRPNNNTSLFVQPVDFEITTNTLYLQQNQTFNNMPLHVERVRNDTTTLYIAGSTVPVSGNFATTIEGRPFTIDSFDLHVSGVDFPSHVGTLQTAGSINAEAVTPTTLVIGQDIDADANTSLYMFAGSAIPEGYTYFATGNALSIAGKVEADFDEKSTLFIAVPDIGNTIATRPLYITTPIPETGVAGYRGSGNITTFIGGNNDAAVFTDFEKGTTLSIVSHLDSSGVAPLYIQRPLANSMSLSIKDQNPSGVMTTFVSGAYIGSGNMTLMVAPPTAKTLPIQTRGFLE